MLALKPPVIPKPKPKRLPRVKAVTIGIGFLCRDGIVVCADNQITWPSNHKYYECKIYPIWEPDCTAAFTFAGNPNLMKSFVGKFRTAIPLVQRPINSAKLRDAVETVLSLMDVLDNDQEGLHLLGGIVVPSTDEMLLLKTERKIVTDVSEYDYVGIGDSSLLRYLGPLLTRPKGEYITRQACHLGAYLVLSAKRYIDGCGGDTDILVIRRNGTVEARSGEAYGMEQQMLKIEHYVRKTATCFFDRRVSKEELDESMKFLTKMIHDGHAEMQILPLSKDEMDKD